MPNKNRLVHCLECGRNKLHYGHGLCKRCCDRQWYEANREHRREASRQWNEANPEYRPEHGRQWKKANPDKNRENSRRCRARKNGATIGRVDEAVVFERAGHMCMYCGATCKKLTIDHIVALNNDGPHCEENLTVACGPCNSSKQDKPLEDWLQTQPYSIAWLF